ncbi:MAG: nucleotide exchange factor GrpE, partial [Bacteroidales bacterium]
MKEEKEIINHEEGCTEGVCNQNSDNLSDKTDKDQEEKVVDTAKNETSDENKGKSKSFFGKKSNKEEKLKEQIEELETQTKELNDKFLRLYSEFDNYKKRTNKEKLELITTASEKVIVNLLPIVDDFERAIQANEKSEDLKSIKEGFELIYHKLGQLLKRFEVEEIPAKGALFDTDLHEAIT